MQNDEGSRPEVKGIDVDDTTVGISKAEVTKLCNATLEAFKAVNCNVLLVVQGEDGSLCVSDGSIVPTMAMHVVQVISAGVFSHYADDAEREVLAAVAASIAAKFAEHVPPPKH